MALNCDDDTTLGGSHTMVFPSAYGFTQFARQRISNDICDDWDGVVQLAGSFSSLSSTRCVGIANVVCIFRMYWSILCLLTIQNRMGWLIVMGGLLLSLPPVWVGYFAAERYLYVASIGFVWLTCAILDSSRLESNVSSRSYGDVDAINWDNSLGQSRDLG